VTDSEEHHMGSFTDRARAALSRLQQDERVKQATAGARNVAAQAEEASKSVSRKVSQEDAWEALRGDVELLTEITRAHHALIVDLIDRVAELEAQAGGRSGG
jgi:molecular chaperone DnaK (HSP70)